MKDKYNLGELTSYEQTPKILKPYIDNNQVIPWDIYNQYHSLKFNALVQYSCKLCGRSGIIKWLSLDIRISYKHENLCSYCYKKLCSNQIQDLMKQYPDYGSKNNPFPFSLYLQWKNKVNTKKMVHIHCKLCNNESTASWNKLKTRIYGSDEEICNNCITKYIANDQEWIIKNSRAQKIAQNRPITKIKQYIAQQKAMRRDPDLIYKKTTRNNRLSGYINNIYFASSSELSYLIYNPQAKNCDIRIPYYFNDKLHYYYPDFIYINNNKIVIVEVKGYYYNKKLIETKRIYSERFINDNDRYDRYELIDDSVIKKLHLENKWQYFRDLSSLLSLKKQNPSLKIITLPESFCKNNQFKFTKEELISYINNYCAK